MKKKIFLTGSNGRIGSFLKNKLKKKFIVIESKINNRWYLIVNSTDGIDYRFGIGYRSLGSNDKTGL